MFYSNSLPAISFAVVSFFFVRITLRLRQLVLIDVEFMANINLKSFIGQIWLIITFAIVIWVSSTCYTPSNAMRAAAQRKIQLVKSTSALLQIQNFEILAPVFSPFRNRNGGFLCISIRHRQPVFQLSNHSVTIFHSALRCFGWCHLHCT